MAVSLGINGTAIHLGLMSILSIVVVSSFDAVGAILVIAMLILPGATAHLISQRLPVILGLLPLHLQKAQLPLPVKKYRSSL